MCLVFLCIKSTTCENVFLHIQLWFIQVFFPWISCPTYIWLCFLSSSSSSSSSSSLCRSRMLLAPCAAGRQVLFALMLLLYLGLGELCVAHRRSLFPLTTASLCGAEMSDLTKETVNVTDNIGAQVGSVKWKKRRTEGLKERREREYLD